MNLGTYPLAANMINQISRIDVVSNNLANLNTTSFKQDNLTEGSFNYYLDRKKAQNINPNTLPKESIVVNTIPKLDGQYINDARGVFEPTGADFDFAIKQKDVFFKIKDPQNGVVLTRDGNFNVVDGLLVNKNGYHVLDLNDADILANNVMVETIALVKTPFDNLQKVGGNSYQPRVQDKVVDIASNKDYLMQGYLEDSNVSAISMMVELIESQRSLEQAQRGITGIDDITKKMIDTLGYSR